MIISYLDILPSVESRLQHFGSTKEDVFAVFLQIESLTIVLIDQCYLNHINFPRKFHNILTLVIGTDSPVSILSSTITEPFINTASHCITPPRAGITMMSPTTS